MYSVRNQYGSAFDFVPRHRVPVLHYYTIRYSRTVTVTVTPQCTNKLTLVSWDPCRGSRTIHKRNTATATLQVGS